LFSISIQYVSTSTRAVQTIPWRVLKPARFHAMLLLFKGTTPQSRGAVSVMLMCMKTRQGQGLYP